jgi:hypothetical protein
VAVVLVVEVWAVGEEGVEAIQDMVGEEEDTGMVTGRERGIIIIITTIPVTITIRVILHLFMAITIRM